MATAADRALQSEYKNLAKETWTNIELINDNIRDWIVALIVLNPDSPYYGGYFKARMKFPADYPYSPPDFKFLKPLFHPNVYTDGRLCISILHPPGDDEMSGELASERWTPAQNVQSILISVLSLLDDAEPSSPANVDAGKMLRFQPDEYRAMQKKDMEESKKDIPAGFVMPKHEDAFKKKEEDDYLMSWDDSDVDEDAFGGSDTDMDDDEDLGIEEATEDEESDA